MSGNYWIMIPPQVAGSEKLPDSAKLVFGRMFSMMTKHGYCFASNEYIGAGLHLSKYRVSHLITELKKLGYIRVEIKRNEKKEIISRRIYPLLLNLAIPIADPMARNSKESIKERDIKKKDFEIFEEDKPSTLTEEQRIEIRQRALKNIGKSL